MGNALFDRVANMDLFAPKKDQNTYGARKKKDLRMGKITEGKSYVPSGMSAAQYDSIRKRQVAKKASNYARNVAKAGVFEDYTEFYIARGTDLDQDWARTRTPLDTDLQRPNTIGPEPLVLPTKKVDQKRLKRRRRRKSLSFLSESFKREILSFRS